MGWKDKYRKAKGFVHKARASVQGLSESEFDEVKAVEHEQYVKEKKDYAKWGQTDRFRKRRENVRSKPSSSVFGGSALNEFLSIGANVNKNISGSEKIGRSIEQNAALIGLGGPRSGARRKRKKRKGKSITINLR